MAVRFDASTDERTFGIGSPPLTFAVWRTLSVDRNDYSTLFSIRNSPDVQANQISPQTEVDGVSLYIWSRMGGGTELFYDTGIDLVVGTPFFLAVVVEGGGVGQLRHYYRTAGQNAFTTGSNAGGTGTPVFDGAAFNSSPAGSAEWFNGDLWNVKVWNRALTEQELLVESFYREVKFKSSLYAHFKLQSLSDVVDRSGNAVTLNDPGSTLISDASDGWQPWKPGAMLLAPPSVAGPATRGLPFGNRSVAFNGGRTFRGNLC